MRELDLKEYKRCVFDEIDNKWGMITAGDKAIGFNGMTVYWGGLGILWNKPVAYIFVRKSRYTHDFLVKSKSMSISFLLDEYKKAKGFFGSKSGRNFDEFKETGLTPSYDEKTNTYYIEEAVTVFLMKVLYEIEITDKGMPEEVLEKCYPTKDMHTMYVCEILRYLEK
jgi:flavin reductase (DIM6/NTAB) family NADH-FMN oxidoreductase RutF